MHIIILFAMIWFVIIVKIYNKNVIELKSKVLQVFCMQEQMIVCT